MKLDISKMYQPTSISDLLRRVVADMRTVRQRDHVEFGMLSWAESYPQELSDPEAPCAVCAAGAYILAECFPDGISGVDDEEIEDITYYIVDIAEWGYDSPERKTAYYTMQLIDDIRSGYIDRGYDLPFATAEALGEARDFLDRFDKVADYDSNDYRDVVKLFNTLADYLERKGY